MNIQRLDLYTRNEWLDLEIISLHHFFLSWSMCRWRAFFQPDWVCHIVSHMLIWCKSGTSTFHVKHFWYVAVHKYHKFYMSMPKDNDFSIGTTIILCLYPFYLFHFFFFRFGSIVIIIIHCYCYSCFFYCYRHHYHYQNHYHYYHHYIISKLLLLFWLFLVVILIIFALGKVILYPRL